MQAQESATSSAKSNAANSIPMLSRLAEEAALQHYPAATLYVVATPIGNLCDISIRALHLLAQADAIACEDTRTSSALLNRYGIRAPLIAAHQHNEAEVADKIIARLKQGQRVALISDAGTPAVSDPGARIVDAVRKAGLQVMPLPGACAAIAALSASGLLEGQFYFVGFLPNKAKQREQCLQDLRHLAASLVFYEAPHRIAECVDSLSQVFTPIRQVVLAREVSKLFEEIWRGPLSEAAAWLAADGKRSKGEFVLIVQGETAAQDPQEAENERVVRILLQECGVKQAAQLAAQLLGGKKNEFYQLALRIQDETNR